MLGARNTILTHLAVAEVILAAAVATSGTFTFNLPSGMNESDVASSGHVIVDKNGATYSYGKDFTVAIALAVVTVTWRATNTLPIGADLFIQMAKKGAREFIDVSATARAVPNRMSNLMPVEVNLGAPTTNVTTAVTTAQLLGAAGALAIDGTLATGGVATFDVPRAVSLTVATTNQSAITSP